ncbi:MAG: glycosyltransferase family 2 protein [bacterium]
MNEKIAIIYLSYHSDLYLQKFVQSIEQINYPAQNLTIIAVDNPHPNYGLSTESLQKFLVPLKEKFVNEVIILTTRNNVGYAGGNNIGIKWALDNDYDYIFLNNQDGYLEPNGLEKILNAIKINDKIGAMQPLVMMERDKEKINTSGNNFHYLGFGFCGNYGKGKKSVQLRSVVSEIGYASGSAIMLRADLLKKHGLLDEDLFCYHEDLEYCMRLRSLGFNVSTANNALFYHDYEFSRNKEKYFLMERNRFAIIMMYYKMGTIIVLLPIFALMEIGILFFSMANHWFWQKMRAYFYWLKPSNWKKVLKKRRSIQNSRIISDKEMLSYSKSEVEFEDINNWALNHIANPILKLYWKMVKRIIFW